MWRQRCSHRILVRRVRVNIRVAKGAYRYGHMDLGADIEMDVEDDMDTLRV